MSRNRDDDTLDAVLFALASEPRRRVLDVLKAEPGCNVNRVCEHFDAEMTRFAVMKHLSVLEAAGLVITEREGREKRLWFNAVPIQWIYERWTHRVQRLLVGALDAAEVRRRGCACHLPAEKERPPCLNPHPPNSAFRVVIAADIQRVWRRTHQDRRGARRRLQRLAACARRRRAGCGDCRCAPAAANTRWSSARCSNASRRTASCTRTASRSTTTRCAR